jgi:hypothetical protein
LIIAISITKRCAFRDAVQEFSNVYHYEAATPGVLASEAELLLDELVTFEKSIHSTVVTFVHGRVWKAGGTIAENTMIFEKVLTGTGSAAASTVLDRERAWLIQWNAGVDSRGHKVKLRKWFHTCGNFGSVGIPSSNHVTNENAFSSTMRTAVAGKADEITTIGPTPEGWELVAESGRQRDGGPPEAHKFLEHRQFGNQWRG